MLVTALALLQGGEVETGIRVALLLRSGSTVECPMVVLLGVVLCCSLLDEVASETAVLFRV